MLEKVRTISGVTRFENGKIHDLLFLGDAEVGAERNTHPVFANA